MTWTAAHQSPTALLRSTHAARSDAATWLHSVMADVEPRPTGITHAIWRLLHSAPDSHFMEHAGDHWFALSSGDGGTTELGERR